MILPGLGYSRVDPIVTRCEVEFCDWTVPEEQAANEKT